MQATWTDEDGNQHGIYTFRPADLAPVGLRTILSLCDGDGEWSKPYRDAGYQVAHIDRDNVSPCDVGDIDPEWFDNHGLCDVWGVLAETPTLELLEHTLAIIEWLKPAWWVIRRAPRNVATRLNRDNWTACVPGRAGSQLFGEFNLEFKGDGPEAFFSANP